MKATLLTYCILLLGTWANAQVSFRAVADKNTVREGERLQITYIIKASDDSDIGNLAMPNFRGFQMLGRNTASNITYNNGNVTRQFMESVILLAQKQGNYTISSAKIKIDNKIQESNTLNIKVLKADKKVKSLPNTLLSMDITLSDDEVYPNQPINAVVKLYAKSYDLLRRRSDIEVPGISGFQVRKVSENEERNFQQEMRNGSVCVSEEIAQFQLMPTKTGELEVPEFKIRLAIPTDFFEEKIVLLKTEPQQVRVKEFPTNAPPEFNGAIGAYQFKTFLEKSNFEVNQPINFDIELIGQGNFTGVKIPELDLNPDLEVYPPKQKNAYQATQQGKKGKIVSSYIIVPQYGGEYKIPGVTFSFFNPETEEYQTITTQSYEITVDGPKKGVESNLTIQDSLNTDSLRRESDSTQLFTGINQKVKDFIKLPDLPEFNQTTKKNIPWFFWLIIPILGLLMYWLLRKKKPKSVAATQNAAFNPKETKNSFKTALSELKEATKHNDTTQFTTVSSFILNQIVAMFAQEKTNANYSQTEGKTILSHKADNHLAEKWDTLYSKNQMMRYAPNSNSETLATLFSQHQELVKESLNKY